MCEVCIVIRELDHLVLELKFLKKNRDLALKLVSD
jgi:hypothetical protein